MLRAMFDHGIGGGSSHLIRDPTTSRLYLRFSTNARVLYCGGFAGLYLGSSGLVGIAVRSACPWVFL